MLDQQNQASCLYQSPVLLRSAGLETEGLATALAEVSLPLSSVALPLVCRSCFWADSNFSVLQIITLLL